MLLPAESNRAAGGSQGSFGQGPGQPAAQSWPLWCQDAPPAWQLLPRAGHVSHRPLCYTIAVMVAAAAAAAAAAAVALAVTVSAAAAVAATATAIVADQGQWAHSLQHCTRSALLHT